MEPKVEAPFGSGISGPKHGDLGIGSDEIRSFISGPPGTTGKNSSFTAVLELPTPQAVVPAKLLPPPSPIFPSNIFLIDKFSVFASADNESKNAHLSTSSSMKLDMVKQELQDTDMDMDMDMDSHHNCFSNHITLKPTKRKEREKKVKESGKKSKKVVTNEHSEEKLPYVHVRARRGQATDSHSLAERARREKINARMKLLQELVPGCNKISGTAMVLDEIINHVQALQREVEFLSMRLAAVNPNIDFNLDAILATERGIRQQQYQQLWHFGELHQQTVWDREEEEEDTSNFITPEPSLLSYDSSGNSGTSEFSNESIVFVYTLFPLIAAGP
ncbi:hypothetical protein ACJIZ3_025817 [Penstemon smallii]|uniref:BHLH domain-containing protein n=1 Tax=Penstemon smallii TaxID=265156 RepID=A0ABD3TX00_9LAMI